MINREIEGLPLVETPQQELAKNSSEVAQERARGLNCDEKGRRRRNVDVRRVTESVDVAATKNPGNLSRDSKHREEQDW